MLFVKKMLRFQQVVYPREGVQVVPKGPRIKHYIAHFSNRFGRAYYQLQVISHPGQTTVANEQSNGAQPRLCL